MRRTNEKSCIFLGGGTPHFGHFFTTFRGFSLKAVISAVPARVAQWRGGRVPPPPPPSPALPPSEDVFGCVWPEYVLGGTLARLVRMGEGGVPTYLTTGGPGLGPGKPLFFVKIL